MCRACAPAVAGTGAKKSGGRRPPGECEDMDRIDGLNEERRFGADPDNVDF